MEEDIFKTIDILRKYNYFKTESSYISVYIYSDRIEIVSPGALYSSNKLEKLDYIENRHSGIPTKNKDFPLQNFMMKEIASKLF